MQDTILCVAAEHHMIIVKIDHDCCMELSGCVQVQEIFYHGKRMSVASNHRCTVKAMALLAALSFGILMVTEELKNYRTQVLIF